MLESAKRGGSLTFHNDIPPFPIQRHPTLPIPRRLKESWRIVSSSLLVDRGFLLEDVIGEGWPRGSQKEISMPRRRIDQTPVNFDPVEPQTRYPLFLPPSLPRFERIIIGGTRTQEPLFATERGGEAYDFSSSLFRFFSPSLLGYQYQEEGQTYQAPTRRNSTPCRRSHGAPLPYDFHVSASGPPKLHDQALYLTYVYAQRPPGWGRIAASVSPLGATQVQVWQDRGIPAWVIVQCCKRFKLLRIGVGATRGAGGTPE